MEDKIQIEFSHSRRSVIPGLCSVETMRWSFIHQWKTCLVTRATANGAAGEKSSSASASGAKGKDKMRIRDGNGIEEGEHEHKIQNTSTSTTDRKSVV